VKIRFAFWTCVYNNSDAFQKNFIEPTVRWKNGLWLTLNRRYTVEEDENDDTAELRYQMPKYRTLID